MKVFLLIGMLTVLSIGLHAQDIKNDSLKGFIKNKKYIPITQKAKLPKAIKLYYPVILDSLKKWYPNYKTYYLSLSTFRNNDDAVFFKLYQLNDISFIRKWDDKILKNKELPKGTITINRLPDSIASKLQRVDDYSGSDGGIGIVFSKSTHSVSRLLYQ